ncbi:MAG: hypothetical protein ACRCZC_03265 [Culicoidibacterales bacterium]
MLEKKINIYNLHDESSIKFIGNTPESILFLKKEINEILEIFEDITITYGDGEYTSLGYHEEANHIRKTISNWDGTDTIFLGFQTRQVTLEN